MDWYPHQNKAKRFSGGPSHDHYISGSEVMWHIAVKSVFLGLNLFTMGGASFVS